MNTITAASLTNGSAATASTSTILAIDLGKYKSVACLHDRDSGEFRFTTFDTSRAELGELLAKERPAVVIIEACLLAGWVRDLCDHCGVRCLVANTASEAWNSSTSNARPTRTMPCAWLSCSCSTRSRPSSCRRQKGGSGGR